MIVRLTHGTRRHATQVSYKLWAAKSARHAFSIKRVAALIAETFIIIRCASRARAQADEVIGVRQLFRALVNALVVYRDERVARFVAHTFVLIWAVGRAATHTVGQISEKWTTGPIANLLVVKRLITRA